MSVSDEIERTSNSFLLVGKLGYGSAPSVRKKTTSCGIRYSDLSKHHPVHLVNIKTSLLISMYIQLLHRLNAQSDVLVR